MKAMSILMSCKIALLYPMRSFPKNQYVECTISMTNEDQGESLEVGNTITLGDSDEEVTDLMNMSGAVDLDYLQFICSAEDQETNLSVTVANTTESPPMQSASSPSETPTALEKPYKHVFWDIKIQFKKRKAPVNQLPSMISSKQYRSLVLNKTRLLNVGKLLMMTKICAYCQRLWSEDNSSHVRSMWVKIM